MKPYLFVISFAILVLSGCTNKVIVYPAPPEEPKSADFEMTVNDQPVFVYQARVSKYPINQIWPGYQRPINQTEIASFASFDLEGEVTVHIISTREIKTLEITPSEYELVPVIRGRDIEIKLSRPMQFSVEVNGYHHALHVFANQLEKLKIDKDGSGVHYFGPGVHEAGIIRVKSNETVYIEGGAVVYGTISSEDASNITIAGRGILDASRIERGKAPAMISLKRVTNSRVGGIILRDSHFWTIIPVNCDSVVFDNLKLIGHWRYNSDGLDIVNCRNIRFQNTFIRTFDDNIVVRGTKSAYTEPYKIIENITVDSCVLWNDWGRAIEIGASIVADTIRNITFSNCQIPRFTAVALDIQNCDRGTIKNIRFENIAIEGQITDSLTIGTTPVVANAWGKIAVLGIYSTFYSEDSIRGSIEKISFNNIRYKSAEQEIVPLPVNDSVKIDENPTFRDYDKFIRDNIYFGDIRFNCSNKANFYFSGFDSTHRVSNIRIKNFVVDGQKIDDTNVIGKNEYVNDVAIEQFQNWR